MGATYEIRLLGDRGQTLLVYTTSCASDQHALDTLRAISLSYVRYEIWRDLDVVYRGSANQLPAAA